MVEQNESITRLYRIGHTEIEITAPLSMKSPRNLEKFRTGQAKRPDDEVIHYQVEIILRYFRRRAGNAALLIFLEWTGIMR